MLNLMNKTKILFDISPKGSQVVIVSIVVVLFFSIISALIFDFTGKDPSLPVIFSAISGVIIIIFWLISRKDIDNTALPVWSLTNISGARTTQLDMHPGSLSSQQKMKVLEKFLSNIQHRAPLPEPDGLVDKSGNPIPNSKEEARERVELANKQANEIRNKILSNTDVIEERNDIGKQEIIHSPEIIEDQNSVINMNKPGDAME